jgi:hypothetical protein
VAPTKPQGALLGTTWKVQLYATMSPSGSMADAASCTGLVSSVVTSAPALTTGGRFAAASSITVASAAIPPASSATAPASSPPASSAPASGAAWPLSTRLTPASFFLGFFFRPDERAPTGSQPAASSTHVAQTTPPNPARLMVTLLN